MNHLSSDEFDLLTTLRKKPQKKEDKVMIDLLQEEIYNQEDGNSFRN